MKFGCDGTEVAEIAFSKKKAPPGTKCGTRRCKSPPAGEHMLYCVECGRAYARELRVPTAMPDLTEEESNG